MLKHFTSLQEDYMGGSVAILNLIGRSKGLEKTLYERQEIVMLDTNLLRNNEIEYYHFDFHSECGANSDPCMEFLKNLVLPQHMEQMGIFIQKNDIVEELTADGRTLLKKLVQDVERM